MKKSSVSILTAGVLALSSVTPSMVYAQAAIGPKQSAALAGVSESEKLALQLAVAAALLDGGGGDLTRVDQQVAAKYNKMRNIYFGTVPMSVVGSSFAGYVGPNAVKLSATVAGPLLSSIQPLFMMAWEGLKSSGRGLDYFFRTFKLDVLFEASSDAVESSYKAVIEPMLKVLVSKEVGIVSGSISSAGLLYTSVRFISNDVQEAMTFDQLRSLIGQDEVMRARVKSISSGISQMLNLNASQEALLQNLIYDEALKQAVANKFSDDASKYSLDIIALMAKNGLIDKSLIDAITKVRAIAKSVDPKAVQQLDAKQVIINNVDVVLNLAAVIESNLNSGRVTDPKTRQVLQQYLGGLSAQLMSVGYYFKKQ